MSLFESVITMLKHYLFYIRKQLWLLHLFKFDNNLQHQVHLIFCISPNNMLNLLVLLIKKELDYIQQDLL